MKWLEENLKTYLHIQIFYIHKIEGDIRQETRGVKVKAESSQNLRIQILYVIIVERKDVLKYFTNN